MSTDQANGSALFAETAALKQRVGELEGQAARLQALYAASEDLVMVLDEHGRYLEFAPTLSPFASIGSEFVGKTMHDVLPAEVADGYLALVRQA